MKHHDQNAKRKVFVWPALPHCVYYWRKSGQELKEGRILDAGANAEAMDGCCLFAFFLI